MIITSHLLSKFINISGIDIHKLCDTLSSIGLEVESCIKIELPPKVVVGKVVEKNPHPDADKLNICQVCIGNETLQIVCGAKNVAKDQYVPVALIGALLPQIKGGELQIQQANLRGVDSYGMICSSTELGLPHINDGIMVLDESIGKLELGKELREYSLFNNHIIDISLTPNRGDCLCVLGIAREISCIFDLPINTYKEIDSGVALGVGRVLQIFTEGKIQSSLLYKVIEVKQINTPLEVELCLAFNNTLQKNPIQNIIEYSTYMSGVILNAYAIENPEIISSSKGVEVSLSIKKDENGFEAVFLDKKLSIIGVGNQIDQNLDILPKTLIIEASYIDPISISKMLFKNKPKQNKSLVYRSTRGSNPQLETGMNCLCKNFSDFTKCLIYSGVQEVKQEYEDTIINTTFGAICNIVGKNIDKEEIAKILKSLNFRIKATCDDDFFSIIPPSYRHDIRTRQDAAEEFLRIYGIQNIPSTPHLSIEKPYHNKGYISYKNQRNIATKALSMGFIETIHYLFYQKEKLQTLGFPTLKENLDLQNPITSELNTLRTSLIPAMLDSVVRNKNFDYKSIKIFEIGSIYDEDRHEKTSVAFMVNGLKTPEVYPYPKGIVWDFYDFCKSISSIIGDFELKPLNENEGKINKTIHPYQSAKIFIDGEKAGIISKLNPTLTKELGIYEGFFCEVDFEKIIPRHIVAKEFSKYPATQKDITILIDKKIYFDEISTKVKKAEIKNLKNIYPLDVYEESPTDNYIALSIRIIIQSMEGTLTENDFSEITQKVLEIISINFNAKLKE
ncbi:phenylalanine--tRNA ligase subunit beta [Helicobacter cappadocius]|uniref:Phenylalanine--tRNA ligase beta subunit n=1 Tax=Helicobacter cappadocius TaxID=3063998 RepID=A0AA90SS50_9HELI|nr:MULTISPECIES: phenylalanine--tRNA ligase subunit beta [unclassified Helicobacter]MDO7252682.1 phenylalanine--tRNA ligase subunit beta [Helicobacter sp. faydin-H75]MDP2538549.1 phenylalanine--tRNA ligase subunit beta [Helicobacter sp. faydin-H76]